MLSRKSKKYNLLLLVITAVFLLSGCSGGKVTGSQQPSPTANGPAVNGYGNSINGGFICSDGAGGLFVSRPKDGAIVHISGGEPKVIEGLYNAARLHYEGSELYFYADKGNNEDGAPIEPGIYLYDGTESRLLAPGVILAMSVADKIYYSTNEGLFSIKKDGSDKKLLKSGFIAQIAYYAGKLYLYEIINHTGTLAQTDADGGNAAVLAANISGGLNAAADGLYYMSSEGIFRLPYGGQSEQIIYGTGFMGLNAVDDGLYYISSSMGEPALHKYSNRETEEIIPPSKLGDVYLGPNIINNKIYYITNGRLYSANLNGTDISEIGID
ncbi:MAG TPA: DUF5050 domain-containing protein [Clostridia bacterium]|nr:DUF5050 domain-containing protein [Clostridia bacterium]